MSAEASDPSQPQDGGREPAAASVAGVLIVLLSTAFVTMLNETTVAVALPAIMGEYQVSAATAQWLLTGFMLTMAVVMPTTGWMLERFSTRAVFIAAVTAFLLGTLLAALAPWFGILLLGRLFPAAATALAITAVGAVSLVVFALRQIRRARTGEALLDLRPLAVRGFTLPILVLLILFGAMLGVMNTLPLHLQGSLLATALVAGLALMPGGLVEAIVSPLAGRLFDRVGPRPLIIPGMVSGLGSLAWLSTVDETTPVAEIIAIHVVFSIGLAAVHSPLMTTALSSLPRGHGIPGERGGRGRGPGAVAAHPGARGRNSHRGGGLSRRLAAPRAWS